MKLSGAHNQINNRTYYTDWNKLIQIICIFLNIIKKNISGETNTNIINI